MGEAFLVNPYDEDQTGRTCWRRSSTCRSRTGASAWTALHRRVHRNTVFAWSERFVSLLREAAATRRGATAEQPARLPVRRAGGGLPARARARALPGLRRDARPVREHATRGQPARGARLAALAAGHSPRHGHHTHLGAGARRPRGLVRRYPPASGWSRSTAPCSGGRRERAGSSPGPASRWPGRTGSGPCSSTSWTAHPAASWRRRTTRWSSITGWPTPSSASGWPTSSFPIWRSCWRRRSCAPSAARSPWRSGWSGPTRAR
jgi:hypothetical protein